MIGIHRLTDNFKRAALDGAFRGYDDEVIEMIYYLKKNDGIQVGPSAALNFVGAVKLARKLGRGHTIATLICDHGDRYKSMIFNDKYLKEHALNPQIYKKDKADLSFVHESEDERNSCSHFTD